MRRNSIAFIVSSMETFELRYFVAVAKYQNVHRAAEELAVSAGSLSKAVARLEAELNVNLFERHGRNIRLTHYGRTLHLKALEILRLEESVKIEIRGPSSSFQVRLAGPEVLLAQFGVAIVQDIKKKYPHAMFELIPTSEAEALQAILLGEVHAGFVAGEVPKRLRVKPLLKTKFQTFVGRGHPLYRQATAGKIIPVVEVLQHEFVSPDRHVLGQTDSSQAPDGWRDDQFPRIIGIRTSSLKLLGDVVMQGKALAYLPDYLAKQWAIKPLKISGCPYTCHQQIKLVANRPETTGWLNELF